MSQPTIGNSQIGVYVESGGPNGFADRADSTISFVNGTRTFSITPTGTDYIVYTGGSKLVIDTVKDLVITDTEGAHYIYFDNDGLLYETATFAKSLMDTFAYVGAIYWSVTGAYNVFVADERHGFLMDADTHYYIHSNPNGATLYVSGLTPSNMVVDGDGNLDTHAQLGIEDGEILDEDLQYIIIDDSPQDISPTGNIPILYRTGATGEWRKKTADTYPFIYAGQEGSTGTLVSFNEWTGATWQFTEIANNNYVLVHIFATNDVNTPIMAIHGITEYTSSATATVGATTELNAITGLPFEEGVAIATFIIQTSNSFTNTPAAAIVSDDNGNDFIDWRVTRTGISAGGTSVASATVFRYYSLTQPTNAQELYRTIFHENCTIVTGFPTSQATSGVATTAETIYIVKRNGSTIGTITYAAAGTTGVFADDTELVDHLFVAGDILSIDAPATADTTHDDLTIGIVSL